MTEPSVETAEGRENIRRPSLEMWPPYRLHAVLIAAVDALDARDKQLAEARAAERERIASMADHNGHAMFAEHIRALRDPGS